jgi:hypothetical protein
MPRGIYKRKPRTPEHCENIRLAALDSWASGTRKRSKSPRKPRKPKPPKHNYPTIPYQKFCEHIGSARGRKIPFLFTFEEWWKIWQDSGHWEERGKRADQYCMARFGDKGPYAVGNVRIITKLENDRERKCSPERRAELRRLMLGNKIQPRKQTTERRFKHSIYAKARTRSTDGRFI